MYKYIIRKYIKLLDSDGFFPGLVVEPFLPLPGGGAEVHGQLLVVLDQGEDVGAQVEAGVGVLLVPVGVVGAGGAVPVLLMRNHVVFITKVVKVVASNKVDSTPKVVGIPKVS